MSIKKTLCGIVAMFFLGLAVSCAKQDQETIKKRVDAKEYQSVTITQLKEKSSEYKGKLIEIKAQPISVEVDYGNIAVVMEDEGKYILAYEKDNTSLCTKAGAIIQSEIDDGDYEPVTIKGKYEGDEINIDVVSANDLSLYFR